MTPLSNLFAPAYRKSDPNSVAAVDAFMRQKYPISGADLESTRMPTAGIDGGVVDPNALRAVSQGGAYDIGARRNAIAAQIQATQAAAEKAKTDAAAANPYAAYYASLGLDPSGVNQQSGYVPNNVWGDASTGGGGA
jgi:hypothetical protein